jgi:hypothetical protein
MLERGRAPGRKFKSAIPVILIFSGGWARSYKFLDFFARGVNYLYPLPPL